MSNIWSSSRDSFAYKCPICHKYISGSSFERHRLKEIEEEMEAAEQ
jgi:hypothetical protein